MRCRVQRDGRWLDTGSQADLITRRWEDDAGAGDGFAIVGDGDEVRSGFGGGRGCFDVVGSDCAGDGFPGPLVDRLVAGGVMQGGGGQGLLAGAGQCEAIAGDLRFAELGEAGFAEQDVVDVEADFFGGPARRVAVGHLDRDAELFGDFVGDGVVAFHVAVERVGEVVGAVDEQDRHGNVREVVGRFPEFDPAGVLVG